MVLSNKKLKKKLRDLAAESHGVAPTSDAQGNDVNQQLQSIKEILNSKSKKRPRRSKKSSKPSKADEEKEVSAQAGDVKAQQKSGKRKRGDGVAEESVDVEPKASKGKKGKDRKKKRRTKGQEEKNDDGEEKESPIVDGNDKGAVESCNAEQSEQNTKVYVGGIPYYSTEDDIRSFFESCGTVNELDCMTFPESGKFRGIAIITFNTKSAAIKALTLDGADMGGFYLKIQPYMSNRVQKTDFAPEMMEGYNRVYVGNLSWDITEDDLKKLFSDCKVSSIRFGTDKATGDFKGYAHVDFADSVSLTVALKLDQSMVCGRPIRIRCAVPLKKAETSSKPAVKKDEDSNPGEKSKKKRRTCYVCGVPGHLSSSCPKKAASFGEGAS